MVYRGCECPGSHYGRQLTPPPPQEPDGHNKPTNSTYLAYKTISNLDGYHPISFTPNCQNYFFTQYASGADIVVPDVYPVGNNVSFSTIYNTPCNRTYGCCGAYPLDQRPTSLAYFLRLRQLRRRSRRPRHTHHRYDGIRAVDRRP
jgi:hypothetical protein